VIDSVTLFWHILRHWKNRIGAGALPEDTLVALTGPDTFGGWAMATARKKRAPATPTEKRKRFIEVLRKTANVSAAAASATIATSTAYRWRTKIEAFRVAWDDAIGAALDDLEAALLDRAVNGVEKPITYAGNIVATVKTYSDNLALAILRARRPEIYAAVHSIAVPSGGNDMAALLELERKLDLVAAQPATIE
jgi:hypothetical protein